MIIKPTTTELVKIRAEVLDVADLRIGDVVCPMGHTLTGFDCSLIICRTEEELYLYNVALVGTSQPTPGSGFLALQPCIVPTAQTISRQGIGRYYVLARRIFD